MKWVFTENRANVNNIIPVDSTGTSSLYAKRRMAEVPLLYAAYPKGVHIICTAAPPVLRIGRHLPLWQKTRFVCNPLQAKVPQSPFPAADANADCPWTMHKSHFPPPPCAHAEYARPNARPAHAFARLRPVKSLAGLFLRIPTDYLK